MRDVAEAAAARFRPARAPLAQQTEAGRSSRVVSTRSDRAAV